MKDLAGQDQGSTQQAANGKRAWTSSNRLGGLRRFATAISVFTILGHLWFGFEQSWLQPLVAIATTYTLELLLEAVAAWAQGRAPRFRGGPIALMDFLLSAHITGLAVAMLLYANDRLWPIAFAAGVAIGSKTIFRATTGMTAGVARSRHYLNPSNFGITTTLLCFPWVGIAQPYHFTENLHGAGNWILPAIIACSGSLLNWRYTRRLPLLVTWVLVFATQAIVRSQVYGTPLVAPLLPMTGVAFMLFTCYMVTDPATTPSGVRGQIAFGAAVALCYGLLVINHVVFGLFFALSIVTAARGLGMYLSARSPVREVETARPCAAVLGEA